jgi:tetratricopeptide (TPR) repeat protein
MLDTTRQYALARLERRGERDAVAGRHAQACLRIARHFEKQRLEVNQPGNLERVPDFLAARERERPNVLAALEWSLVQRHDVELGQRLVVATWGMRGIWDAQSAEPLKWARIALDAVQPDTPLDLVAKLSRVVSVYWERRQDYPSALAALERCAAILIKLGNPSEVGNALTMAYLRLGRLEDAKASAEALVSQLRAQSGQEFLGEALLGLGGAYFAEERYPESHALCVEARQRFETERDGYMLAICDSQLATSYSGLGDAESALSHAQSATTTMRAWRHAFLPEMLSNEATFLIALDRFDEAYERAMEALHLTHELLLTGMPSRSVLPMQRLATIAALRPYEATEDPNAVRERAAILLGYVDARLTAQGAFRFPTDRKDVERATSALRQRIGEELLSSLLARGATIGDDAALALARDL